MSESSVASLYTFLEDQGITRNKELIANGLRRVSEYSKFITQNENSDEAFQKKAVKEASDNIEDIYSQMKDLGVDDPAALFQALHSTRL